MLNGLRNNIGTTAVVALSLLLSGCFDLGGSETTDAASPTTPPPPPPPPPAANAPPSISGAPTTTAIVGQQWTFTPSASDPDGDTLSFDIENQPPWADFDSGNGTLSGVPLLGQEGTYSDIVIMVSDGQAMTALPSFTMTVQNMDPGGNNAPQISGTPANTAAVGEAYSFRPIAMDPDGDSLTFSIVNQPSWAIFNTSTGRLSGTPGSGDIRIYNDIAISVSDGELSASLPSFSIDVVDAPTGSVTLTWTPPTTNTDGSPLTDLSAYKFYYGLSENDLANVIRVDNPGITTYVIDELTPNTYYFATTVVNSGEVESELSNIASIAVNAN